nr:MAG TPA: hypothetical protein [Caudoviricetes sp.]
MYLIKLELIYQELLHSKVRLDRKLIYNKHSLEMLFGLEAKIALVESI